MSANGPASSSLGHRRAISHGDGDPSKGGDQASHHHPHLASLGLPSHLQQGTSLYGQTPSYELHTDPLEMSINAPSQSQPTPTPPPQHRQRIPHQAQPSTSSVSIIPPTPPSAPAPKKAKTMHVDTASASANWKRRYAGEEDGFKRPTSPHITSATPTSAYHQHHHHRALSPYDPSSSRTGTPVSRSPSVHQPHDAFTPPKRQGSLSRAAAAAQQMLEKVGGSTAARASPVMFRAPNRSNTDDGAAERAVASAAFLDDSDDEADKGHGRDHHHRRSFTSASHRWGTPAPRDHTHPRKQASDSTSGTAPRTISRTGSRGPFHPGDGSFDGRKTPAKYRPPAPSAKSHSADVPSVASSGSAWSSRLPHSSISIDGQAAATLDSDGVAGTGAGSSSPIVIPQARRGAMNLKTPDERTSKKQRRLRAQRRRLRRQKRARLRASKPSRPFHVALLSMLSTARFHIIHPIHTTRKVKSSVLTTARSIDLAFREPQHETGKRVWWPEWLGAYIPLLIWLGVSVSSTVIVLIFHTQVFRALDQLSRTLQSLGLMGRMVLGSLIFLTTFPPLPLYSTLIVLCGFSFGLWQGFVISYIAALSGAIVVYLLSKSLLRGWMTNLLEKSGGLKKVVRAIEKRPKLLFLIRLAPYPYNLMNTLLASSPTLTFKTYVTCTALALPKLLVHCGLGTSIKNFAAYHGAADGPEVGGNSTTNATDPGVPGATPPSTSSHTAETVKKAAGLIGVGLCIGIFLYLFSVARRAVDEELDDSSDEYDALEMISDEEGGDEEDDEKVHRGSTSDEELLLSDEDETTSDEDEEGGLYTLGNASASRSFSRTDLDAIVSSRERSMEEVGGGGADTASIRVNEIEALAEGSLTLTHSHWTEQTQPNDQQSHFRIASPDQADEGEISISSAASANSAASQVWFGSSAGGVGDDPYGMEKDAPAHGHGHYISPSDTSTAVPAAGTPLANVSHSNAVNR